MKRFLLWCFLGVLLSGCATMDTWIQDLNLVSVEEEKVISEKMAEAVSQEMTFSENTEELLRIERMGERLVSFLPEKKFVYRFYLVEAKDPNAFAIPGGRIYIHTGLLDFADSESEVAGVLAHEIAHVYERHPVKALTRIYGIDLLTQAFFKDSSGMIKTMALGLAKNGLMSRYSREDEREADEIGYRLLSAAGYPTDGLVRFLQKLSKLSPAHPVPFLSTHPPTPERIERLEAIASSETRRS